MTKKLYFSTICILLITTILCSLYILPVSAITEAKASALEKIHPALQEKMETALPNEKIPVAIWYKDIDQDNVDKLTIDKVGFTQDDIALTYEMPSTELINNLEKGKTEAIGEMQTYLKRTEAKRKTERERTNEYVMTRREFSREKYVEKTAKVIKDTAIKEKNITFKSQYAPMIIVEMNCTEINVIATNRNIQQLSLFEYPHIIDESITSVLQSSNVTSVQSCDKLSLTGNNVKVGIVESFMPNFTTNSINGVITPLTDDPLEKTVNGINVKDYGNCVIIDNMEYTDNSEHANTAVELVLSVAPEAKLYCSEYNHSNIEVMLSEGVDIINMSVGFPVSENNPQYNYTTDEKWLDHIVANQCVTIIKSAGNNGSNNNDVYENQTIKKYGPRVTSPGLAYNIITVGGFFDALGNNTYASDTMDENSSYKNCIVQEIENTTTTLRGCEKPDVVLPQLKLDNGRTGTSFAAPLLTGIITILCDLKPSLSTSPLVIKAITLASCHRKVLSYTGLIEETSLQGITEKQGAGAPDAWSMMAIVCQGTYGIGVMEASTTQKTIRFTQPSYGATNMNISLTWLKNNSYETGESHSNTNLIDEGNNVNLNMYVYRNGSLLKSSALENSSTEMAYFSLNSSYPDYEVRINKASTTTEDVRYGFAYSTDNMLMTEETNEGVYRLKNLETGTYLTLDASTGELKHQSYADSSIQEWIVRQSAGCQISSAYGTAQGTINRSNTALNTKNYKAVLGNNTLNLSMLKWYNNPTLGDKGGVILYSYIGGTQIFLDYYSNYITLSSGTSNSTNSKIWMLEKVNYIRGDANADGKYNISDATLVQKYLSHEATLNNLKLFLADANYDGSVTIKDVSKIQRELNSLT